MKKKFSKTITQEIHFEGRDIHCGHLCKWIIDNRNGFQCLFFDAPLDEDDETYSPLRCKACLDKFQFLA